MHRISWFDLERLMVKILLLFFCYVLDIKSLTFFLVCVRPSRRPRSYAQGVRGEANGPISEARRDAGQQAPLTHTHTCQNTHTGSIGTHTHGPTDGTQAKTKAEAQGCDMPYVCSQIYHTLFNHPEVKRTHFEEHWLNFVELNTILWNQNTLKL